MTEHADLVTHHIEGYARAAIEAGKDGAFRVPLVSHIAGNLYVGGCINGAVLPDDFAHVVSLYKWERYILGTNTQLHEYEMYDAAEMPNENLIAGIALDVVRYVKDGKTLVHCQAGLNRSNLIAALALVYGATNPSGMRPTDAITLLRERRSPVVLCNTTFEAWLLGREVPA